MLNTSRILLIETSRNLIKKVKESPILYLFFSSMLFFSIVMFAFLTFFLLHTKTTVNFIDVFYMVFFLFLLKSAADLHTYYITAPQMSYPLSINISQRKTVGEIVIAIVFINMGLWFAFSALYLVCLSLLNVRVGYPVEYLLFSINLLISIVLGCTVSLHFFSSKKYRLLPTLLLLLFIWYTQSLLFITLMLPVAFLHIWWALHHPLDSYRFVKRKERTKERRQAQMRGILSTLFYRETTVVWRERLYFHLCFHVDIDSIGYWISV